MGLLIFFGPPLPKTGQSGGCGCGAGTWLPLYCAALQHRIVPPAATCSVVAQSGGEVLLLYSTERNWAAGKRKVGRRERDGFPPVLAPGSARPRRKCFPPNSRLPTKCCSNLNKWEIFQKTNKVQRGNNSVYCHVFLFNKSDVFEKCTLQKIAAKDPHFVKNGVKASM